MLVEDLSCVYTYTKRDLAETTPDVRQHKTSMCDMR